MGRIVEKKIDHGSHVNPLTHGFNQFGTTVLKDLFVLIEMFRRDKIGQLLIVGHFPELSPYRTGDGTRNQSQNNKKENTLRQNKTMSDLKVKKSLYDCTNQNQGRPSFMNSEGFCVPLTKNWFGDADRSILEIFNKKH